MEAGKKAEVIFQMHLENVRNQGNSVNQFVRKEIAKKAALITVGEILCILPFFNEDNAFRESMKKSYWIKVRNEIEKL